MPLHVSSISVTVSDCDHGNQTNCPVVMATRGGAIPGANDATEKATCSKGLDSCVVNVFHPSTGQWNYLEILTDSEGTLTATAHVRFAGKYMEGLRNTRVVFLYPHKLVYRNQAVSYCNNALIIL